MFPPKRELDCGWAKRKCTEETRKQKAHIIKYQYISPWLGGPPRFIFLVKFNWPARRMPKLIRNEVGAHERGGSARGVWNLRSIAMTEWTEEYHFLQSVDWDVDGFAWDYELKKPKAFCVTRYQQRLLATGPHFHSCWFSVWKRKQELVKGLVVQERPGQVYADPIKVCCKV